MIKSIVKEYFESSAIQEKPLNKPFKGFKIFNSHLD